MALTADELALLASMAAVVRELAHQVVMIRKRQGGGESPEHSHAAELLGTLIDTMAADLATVVAET